MSGREGRDAVVRAPLIGGVVGDFERRRRCWRTRQESGTGGFNSPQAVMSMVWDVTQVEQRRLKCRREESSIGKVFMMEGLAAAFGAVYFLRINELQ